MAPVLPDMLLPILPRLGLVVLGGLRPIYLSLRRPYMGLGLMGQVPDEPPIIIGPSYHLFYFLPISRA